MYVRKYINLADSDVGCNEPNEMNETQCIKRSVMEALAEKNFQCIPSIFKLFALPDTKVSYIILHYEKDIFLCKILVFFIKVCKSGQESIAKDVTTFILSHTEKVRAAAECKMSCHLTMHDIIKSEYGIMKG